MDTSRPSRDLALPVATQPDEGPSWWRLAAAPAFLRGRGGLLALAAVLAVTGFLAGWAWLGTAAVLPLLYALPCAAMMAMCMKGHGGPGGNASAGAAGTSGGSQARLSS